MRKLFGFLLLICSLSPVLVAQTGFRLKTRSSSELYADQRRAIGAWCRQDFEGLRLNDAGWDRFKSITSFKKNPEFNSVVIVSRYQAEPRDSMSWDMEVTYTIVGRYEHGSGYFADAGTQTVTFQTKDIDGEVVIVNVDPIAPHVSKKAAIEWMKKELETTTSDVEKIHLQDALKLLDTASPVANATPAK